MSDYDKCDESKCLSTGLMPVSDSGESSTDALLFNCYGQGPGTMFPFLCADGYTGVTISDETTNDKDPDVVYYTCCPNDQPDPPPVRECLNPQPVESDDINGECQTNSPSHPFGRFMTDIPGLPQGYMCCDVPLALGFISSSSLGNVTSAYDGDFGDSSLGGYGFSEPANCYPQLFCGSCTVKNTFGNVQMMNCYNDVYQYPQITMIVGNMATYECCQEQPSNSTSPFVISSTAYQATIWTQFALALVASCMSLLLIVAVGRSLCLARTNNKSQSVSRGRRTTAPNYSSYNLYLIFLAIPDLMYNLFMLGIVSESFDNGWLPHNDALITFCATLNQYMSAVIANEVLLLLQRTKQIQRYIPPSYKKAAIQFGVVSIYATVLAVLWYMLLYYFRSGSSESMIRSTVAIPLRRISMPIFYVLVVVIPRCI